MGSEMCIRDSIRCQDGCAHHLRPDLNPVVLHGMRPLGVDITRQEQGVRCGPLQQVGQTCTLRAVARCMPELTMLVNSLSVAISHCTSTSAPSPEPGTASGDTVTRVQIITEFGIGSPEATPCINAAYGAGAGSCGKRAEDNADEVEDSCARAGTACEIAAPAATAAEPVRERRRGRFLDMRVSISPASRSCNRK